jgi:hypothetical protein
MKIKNMDAYDATKSDLLNTPVVSSNIQTWRFQWIGIPLLIMIPILSLLGVFDRGTNIKKIEGHDFKAKIEFPGKLRDGEVEYIRIEVTNTSSKQLDKISAGLNREYFAKFSDVTFFPEANDIYEVELKEIPSGQSRYIDIKVKAREFGTYKGELKLTTKNSSFKISLTTFVFP